MIVETIDGLEDGSIIGHPQNPEGITRAPKLAKEDGSIDWNLPATQVRNLIRGMNPVPGAHTQWQGKPLKVHRAEQTEGSSAPGTVLGIDDRQGLIVACSTGALLLTEVQPAGKAAMEGTAFVRGYPIETGARLGT